MENRRLERPRPRGHFLDGLWLEPAQKPLGKSIFGQNGRGDATAPGTIEHATLERPRPRGPFLDGL